MSADITLTFQAIGAEKIVSEVKKIQDSIREAVKGLDLSGLDALKESIDKATAAAEEMNATLADAEVDDLGEDVDDAAESMGGFEASAGKAKSGVLGFNAAAIGIGAALAAAAVAIKAAKAAFDLFVDGVMDAFKTGQEFSKMAAALGTDAGSARVLAQAFTEAGMSAQSVVPMVSKMQRKIAEGSAAFKALGLDVESLKGKSAIEQIEAIGDAVRGVSDQEGKMKVLMAIFEEAGPQLSKLFNNPDAIENATATLGSSVQIMRENAEAFDRAAVLISNISTKIGTFFEGVAAGVVGPLNMLLEAFNSVDIAEQGRKFGEWINKAVVLYYKAFKNGALFELIYAKLAAAVTGAADSFGRHMVKSVAQGISVLHGLIGGTIDALLADDDDNRSWTDHFMANYNQVQGEATALWDGSLGKVFGSASNEWRREAERLERSINRNVPGNPLEGGDEKKSPKIDLSGSKLDLSGLLKGLGGSPSFTPKTDALQRVGGTIGGMSSAQLAPARKTADNTSKLVGLANDIRSAIKTRQTSSTVAVYA